MEWININGNKVYEATLAEMYRRALKQHVYRKTPSEITEARWKSDGYTTIVVLTIEKVGIHAYAVAVKGPNDKYSEYEGISQAIRKACDNAIIIMKQKDSLSLIKEKIEEREAQPAAPDNTLSPLERERC